MDILGRQLKSSLIYLLAFASVFSFVLRDFSDGSIITVILVINASLGFLQEYRSEVVLSALCGHLSIHCGRWLGELDVHARPPRVHRRWCKTLLGLVIGGPDQLRPPLPLAHRRRSIVVTRM